jgi:hypothetical protein
MDTSRCDKVIQFALLEAGRQDDYTERELGPIHLLKYVYLADLEHAERRNGETFTGAHWTFYHYGPWAQEVHQRIEPALAAIDADKQLIPSAKYDDDFVRWRKRDDELYDRLERELPLPVVSSIRRNVRKFGKDTRELLQQVYATGPMRRAIPRGELEFFVAEPVERGNASVKAEPRTARQLKKQAARVAQAKVDIKVKLAARRAARAKRAAVAQPPRYDDVFFQGLSWLDELGSGGEGEGRGEAEFDDDVWTSDTRGEDRE